VVDASQELERGRTSFERRAWLDAYTALSEADRVEPLEARDLDLLATSASLIGRMDEYLAVLESAHLAHIDRGDNLAAARSAGWLGMTLAIRGELGPASGWFGRAQRLVEREGRDCVEQGWLLVPAVFQREAAGDYDGAHEVAAQWSRSPSASATRTWPQSLNAQGVMRIAGRSSACSPDEAMVGHGRLVSPMVAGTLLRSIAGCGRLRGTSRTGVDGCGRGGATGSRRWSSPPLSAYRRSAAHGEWRDALPRPAGPERCEEAMNRAATGQAPTSRASCIPPGDSRPPSRHIEKERVGREPRPGWHSSGLPRATSKPPPR
jgi:hypothetical protein